MLENKIRNIIEETIVGLGYKLENVLLTKEEGQDMLMVVIDKEGTVSIDDCVTVTKAINPILDQHDLIKDSYILDVSSNGKDD